MWAHRRLGLSQKETHRLYRWIALLFWVEVDAPWPPFPITTALCRYYKDTLVQSAFFFLKLVPHPTLPFVLVVSTFSEGKKL